jgi:hypothetical protein
MVETSSAPWFTVSQDFSKSRFVAVKLRHIAFDGMTFIWRSESHRINGHAGQDPIEDGGTDSIEKKAYLKKA